MRFLTPQIRASSLIGHHLDADTYTGKPFSYTSPSSPAPAPAAPPRAPAPVVHTHTAPSHSHFEATVSRPSNSGGDEIDALIAGARAAHLHPPPQTRLPPHITSTDELHGPRTLTVP